MKKLLCWFGWHGELIFPEYKYEKGNIRGNVIHSLTGYCSHCGKKLI